MRNNKKFVTFVQNPEIDILLGYMDISIPSKKQDFKPVEIRQVYQDGKVEILNNFYVKKPNSKSVREFEELIRSEILESEYKERKITKPHLVEVGIFLTITKKKYFDIDVDNIAKTVLDSITGYLIDDDSQVKRVICQKDIHPLNKNGFFIAITKLTEKRNGLLGNNYYLYSEKKE